MNVSPSSNLESIGILFYRQNVTGKIIGIFLSHRFKLKRSRGSFIGVNNPE